MGQIEVKVKLDLPPGVELLGYERSGEGHGFEVKFPLPDACRWEKCGHEEPSTYEHKNTVYVVGDLDLWGQPSLLIFQPCFHRCSRCGHRQEHFAPFNRRKVMYTYCFEEYVLRMLIGSNEAEVATRWGISAQTVERIVEKELKAVYDMRARFKEIFDTAPDRATAEQQLAELRARTESLGLDFSKNSVAWVQSPHPTARAGLQQVLDDLRPLEDGHLELLRRALHQRGGRWDQQQGPRDHEALLRREVLRHALEAADSRPEAGFRGGRAEHRRATRDRHRPNGRISRVLHLEAEEPMG